MDVDTQLVRFSYPGPIEAGTAPSEVLYGACLRFGHASSDPRTALVDAMKPIAGDAQRRSIWRPSHMSWDHNPFRLTATAGDASVTMRSANRLQPGPLKRLTEALAAIDGARDLEIEAEIKHYSEALTNLRACTPCQARRL